jgi:prepilin-type N-terminal cleavage/methylation domain-containing protein/prepilin-type processing-associated H-X9-DG protein
MKHPASRKSVTKERYSGFTLIELLVVIAIIGILASILFPVFARARENANRASCQSNMKQMGLGIHQYMQDYDERFPRMNYGYPANTNIGDALNARWMDVIQPYVKSKQIFTCPSSSLNNLYEDTNYRAFQGGGAKYWLGTYVWNVAYWDHENNSVTPPYANAFGPMNGVHMAKVESATTTINVLERQESVTNDNAECAFNKASTNGATFVQPNAGFPLINNAEARHLGTTNVLFCDGHVKAYTVTALNHRNASGILDLFTMAND